MILALGSSYCIFIQHPVPFVGLFFLPSIIFPLLMFVHDSPEQIVFVFDGY